MRELDISTWKEFRIGDLFEVVTKTTSSSLSATTKQFLAVAIQASNRDYYSFDRQFRKDDAFELTIPLPATDSGERT